MSKHKRYYKTYKEAEYIVFEEDAIKEVLFEHLVSYRTALFSEEQNIPENVVCQMVFDKKQCRCVYVLTTMDKRLPAEDMDFLLKEKKTTDSVC